MTRLTLGGLAIAAVAVAMLVVATIAWHLSNETATLTLTAILGVGAVGTLVVAAVQAQASISDRELGVQPFLLRDGYSDSTPPGVILRNIGRGPAVNVRVFHLRNGVTYWNATGIAIAAGERAPVQVSMVGADFLLLEQQARPGRIPDAVVGAPENLVAYTVDQLGNELRFNLRTAEPPKVRRRGRRATPWSGAWKLVGDAE